MLKFKSVLAILSISLSVLLSPPAMGSTAKTTKITDLAGRTVDVKCPVDRIVLGSARYLHEFAAVGGKEVLDKIVGWGSDLEKYDMDTYMKYTAAFPKLTKIPDVIIISGSKWEKSDAMQLGYFAEPQKSRKLLKSFLSRSGWNTLSAVKNNRVHSSFHGFSFRIFNFVGVQAFAKWMYPEEFKDVDPEANFREFHQRFLPIDFSGVWTINVGD